jgi:hypothetical protein
MPQFAPAPNNPHCVVLSNAFDRTPSPPDLDEVMRAITSGDENETERLAQQHARPGGARTLSLQRGGGPVFATSPRDADPAVVRARLAQLGGGRSAPSRPLAVVALGKEPRALPDADAKLDELLRFLTDADPEFGKLDVVKQRERAQALRSAIASVVPTVAASRGGPSKPVLLLSAFGGRNQVEQAVSALRTADAKFATLPWDSQVRAAGELIRFFHGRIV